MNEEENVKLTISVNKAERKLWKQFAVNHDMTVTTAIKRAMQRLIEAEGSGN